MERKLIKVSQRAILAFLKARKGSYRYLDHENCLFAQFGRKALKLRKASSTPGRIYKGDVDYDKAIASYPQSWDCAFGHSTGQELNDIGEYTFAGAYKAAVAYFKAERAERKVRQELVDGR